MSDWTRVVVGVDGSDYSKSALRWAADEARAHGAELTAVSVWAPHTTRFGTGWDPELDPELQVRAFLQASVDEVLGPDPGLVVHQIVHPGNASKVLIDLSDGADLLVIAGRGEGGFVGMLLGSVSQHVASHAKCPVVVVR
jgi:nucleotide-binding universal stress UspA family protein